MLRVIRLHFYVSLIIIINLHCAINHINKFTQNLYILSQFSLRVHFWQIPRQYTWKMGTYMYPLYYPYTLAPMPCVLHCFYLPGFSFYFPPQITTCRFLLCSCEQTSLARCSRSHARWIYRPPYPPHLWQPRTPDNSLNLWCSTITHSFRSWL